MIDSTDVFSALILLAVFSMFVIASALMFARHKRIVESGSDVKALERGEYVPLSMQAGTVLYRARALAALAAFQVILIFWVMFNSF